MKKFLPLFIVVTFIFTACPGVYLKVHRHSIARIKEKYACNVEIVNNSSSMLQYRYAPLKTRKDYESLPYIPNLNKVMEKIKTDGLYFFYEDAYSFNVFGTIDSKKSALLHTGIDGGVFSLENPSLMSKPNSNLDGLPARFIFMVDGDTTCYSLVCDCEEKDQTTSVTITDETINRLKTFKDEEFEIGYNGKREWYGKSVKIQEGLYCFGRYDYKRSALNDYTDIDEFGRNFGEVDRYDKSFYGRIPYLFPFITPPENHMYNKELILFYNDNDSKFYSVKQGGIVKEIN